MSSYETSTFEDAFNLFCGELLGKGIHRAVYACAIRPDLVVKVELESPDGSRNFANVHEFSFWRDYGEIDKIKQWLAPCEMLSADGRILLQKRVTPVHDTKLFPAKLPSFLTDTKLSNYGMLDGRLVCADYALTVLNAETNLQKVTWRKE